MDIAKITHHPLIWAMPQREDVFFPGSFPFIPAWKIFGLYLLILATYENWRRRLVGSFKSWNWLSWFLQLVRLGHFWCQKDVVCIDHLVHDDDWFQWESWWPFPPSACSCRPRCEQSSSSGHANQVHPVKCHVLEVEPFHFVFEIHFVNKTACGNNPGNARRDQNFNQNRQKIKQNTDKGIKNKDTTKRHIIVNKKVVYKVSPCWYYMPNPRLFLEIKFSETCFEAEI